MSAARARAEVAAIAQENIVHPNTHFVTRAANYNVPPGAAPTFVPFSGTVSRFTVQHTSGVSIGNIPYKVMFSYRRIGSPAGNVNIGIRKVAGDTFSLIGQYPLEPNPSKSWTPTDPIPPTLHTVTVEGGQSYQMVASDKVSIEFPPSASDTIELACSTGLPAGFTSQSWNGSAYSATAAPLAIKITSRILTPI